jgi:hypothetical protein
MAEREYVEPCGVPKEYGGTNAHVGDHGHERAAKRRHVEKAGEPEQEIVRRRLRDGEQETESCPGAQDRTPVGVDVSPNYEFQPERKR